MNDLVTPKTLTNDQIREFLRDVTTMDMARHCFVALGVEVYDHDHDADDGIPEARARVAAAINARPAVGDIRHEDLVDLTFEVAERIAQYLLDAARSSTDLPQHDMNQHDALCWAALQIRTNAWHEGWDRDPALTDPRTPLRPGRPGSLWPAGAVQAVNASKNTDHE